MSSLYWSTILSLAAQLPRLLAHPYSMELRQLEGTKDPFIFAALGDSWASGVSYPHIPSNNYDDNKSGCNRYKYAWSTYVDKNSSDWVPEGMEPKFEFVACSGRHIEQVLEEMDHTTRPKVVLMEIGGNNAEFYPMASACLFHDDKKKDYKPHYEDDDKENPKGLCRKEIKLVRDRLTGQNATDMGNTIKTMINNWKGNSHVWNSGASLFLLGYAKMFNDQTKGKGTCDDWTYSIVGATSQSNVVGYMNDIIKGAVESFNDPKIQYIDIDSAFQGHRFCEPGQSNICQFNWDFPGRTCSLWIWNNPARAWAWGRDDVEWTANSTSQDGSNTPPPPVDFNKLTQSEDLMYWTSPDDPDHIFVYTVSGESDSGGSDGAGSIHRTLHPTAEGHEAMAKVIVNRLKQEDFSDVNRKALSIVITTSIHPDPVESKTENKWRFFTTKIAHAVGCGEESDIVHEVVPQEGTDPNLPPETDYNYPPWPGGDFKLNLYGEDCTYKNDYTNPGRLFCSNKEIPCMEDPAKGKGKDGTNNCNLGYAHAVVFCEW